MKLNAINAFSARIIIIVSVVVRAEGFQRIYGVCLAVNYARFQFFVCTDTLHLMNPPERPYEIPSLTLFLLNFSKTQSYV